MLHIRTLRPFVNGFCKTLPSLIVLLGLFLPEAAFAASIERGEFFGEVSGYLESNVTAPLRRNTPHEDPSGRLKLEGTCEYGQHLRFKLTTRTTYDGTVRDPTNDNPLQEFDEVYPGKPLMIEFEEAYLEVRGEKWDVRTGIQKIQWGKLDELNPTDNLNPQDFSHFVLDSLVDRKIGVPMVKLNLYPTWDTKLEAAWVPVVVPYRLARPGERWYPPVLQAPERVDLGIEGLPPVEIAAEYPEIDLPPRTFENSEVAVRLSTTLSGTDLSLSYFYGYDTYTPVVKGEGVLDVFLTEMPELVRAIYRVDVEPDLTQIHVLGLEFGRAFGPVTVRSEWAYFWGPLQNKGISTSDLGDVVDLSDLVESLPEIIGGLLTNGQASVDLDPELSLERDMVRGGVGVDYIYGDHLFSGQLIMDHIRDHDSTLLGEEFEVSGTLDLRFSFLDDSLHAELAGMYNFATTAMLLRPEVSYKILPMLKGSFRLVYINGPRDSVIGQYKDNDQLQLMFRYSF
jgi:hypothetical protein